MTCNRHQPRCAVKKLKTQKVIDKLKISIIQVCQMVSELGYMFSVGYWRLFLYPSDIDKVMLSMFSATNTRKILQLQTKLHTIAYD